MKHLISICLKSETFRVAILYKAGVMHGSKNKGTYTIL